MMILFKRYLNWEFLGFDNVLIVVSLTGIYLYSIFSAFALLNNQNPATWIAYVKIVIVILEFIEGTIHAFFILVALRKRLNRTSKHEYPAREVITLLIILDLSLWFEETTTTTKHEANPFQLAFYHVIPWSIIAAIATPLQIFFRFHASVWENMYTLPAYESVAPHGLWLIFFLCICYSFYHCFVHTYIHIHIHLNFIVLSFWGRTSVGHVETFLFFPPLTSSAEWKEYRKREKWKEVSQAK
jgi:hypothetical protein